GRFWRISHEEIDRFLGSPVMRREFSKERVTAFNDEDKTADYKYRLIENKSLFKEHTFEACGKNRMGDSLVKFSDGGSLRGTIVFTGQPSLWSEPLKYNKGKYYEFVFPERKEATRKISGDEFKHFEFIYKKTKGDKVSEDWKRIKRLLDESESGGRGVPVFFIPKGKEGIEHFGMAYLYKMPYDHSVFESLPEAHRQKDKRDLAECIFGYIDKEDSLKGRVQFGHAFASEARPLERIRLVLGSPKASYYPLYVSQEGKGGVTADYNTYDHGTPSGWKRYYVRKDTNSVKDTGQDKVDTYMEPLDKGAKFRGTVSFHNLRPVELGALLSALTFHNTPECRHQLGMAKAYGFGKCRYSIKLNITAVSYHGQPKNAEYYMARFEDYMSRHVASPWTQQQPIKELFTMAGNDVANGGAFDFMTMDLKTNEFEQAKTDHEYLQRATSLLPRIIAPKTLCDTPEYKAEEEKRRRLEKLRFYIDEMKKQIALADNDNNSLNRYKAEIANKMAEEKDFQAEFAHLIAMIDQKMEQNRQLEFAHFKEDYEQRITLSGTDKSLLNNIKAELGNLRTDDKDMQDIITGLLAKIDQIIAQMPQAGFQDAFKTAIVDYKLFETRVKAGLKKTPLDKLTQADKDFGAVKLQEAYDHDAKKSSKDWAVTTGRYFKKCVKIVGNDIATEWFTKLKR
ncbi:MAG: TIGR03986 family CRISPR-associated RAMP protein, partial [Prevotella sp.]